MAIAGSLELYLPTLGRNGWFGRGTHPGCLEVIRGIVGAENQFYLTVGTFLFSCLGSNTSLLENFTNYVATPIPSKKKLPLQYRWALPPPFVFF